MRSATISKGGLGNLKYNRPEPRIKALMPLCPEKKGFSFVAITNAHPLQACRQTGANDPAVTIGNLSAVWEGDVSERLRNGEQTLFLLDLD